MTYTREQILALEPGRELDKIVAEHVTKYQSLTTHLNADGTFGYLPNYSTDIAAAWEVVKHMKDSWEFVLSSEDGKWEVIFYWDVHKPCKTVKDTTAELAICKAALLAVLDL